ncbi:MAG TPA: DNA polymerase III subunit epsilon [Candidatus Corynebacterium avicola]|uniref:DNA polymerase III subunit epsilon n=1 Tax=Candidatus Corynebacterium avicola TaxID=2838527 RepID=A0A9D1UKL4_9CORY|nr:DNA polymerase III subunit epsilon [Candidatus Corynebacterium avicola]
MTSSGSSSPDHSGDTPSDAQGAATPDSGAASRSRRRRRRQVHRRAAPPSQQTRERAESLAANLQADAQDKQSDAADQADQANDPDRADTTTPGAGGVNGGSRGSGRPTSNNGRGRNLPKTFHGTLPSAEDAPFVEITVATSGIHPSTSRLVSFAATLHTGDGERVSFEGNRPASADPRSTSAGDADHDGDAGNVSVTGIVQQVNPGEDPGPWHLHGYSHADLGQAPGFATIAPLLFELIEGRALICHNAALTWGFLQYEYRRAQRASNRGNQRGNSRGRRRGQRKPKKIAVPTPASIVDTLGTARRQASGCEDPRLRSIAAEYVREQGLVLPQDALPHIGPQASDERAALTADDLLLADTRLLFPLYRAQRDAADGHGDNEPGGLSAIDPGELSADRFGLQRSTIRVDATSSPRPFGNPGTPQDGQLVEGMEIVVSPDVATDPDVLISAAMRAGLVYSEKLNRTSSLVVCNANHPLRGKAMHGERKSIPLYTDEEFLKALDDVAAGSTEVSGPEARPATPRIPPPQQGGRNRKRKRGGGGGKGGNGKSGNSGGNNGGGGRNRQRSGGGRPNQGQKQNQGHKQKQGQGSSSSSKPSSSSNRRRRRRGSGKNHHTNQNQG